MVNSVHAVDKGLPPGLWLPTAKESTGQYLRENFNHPHHSYEDIVDYGSFVVALAFLEAEKTDRVSMMPTRLDFIDMFSAGYGVSPDHHLQSTYGGVSRLQHALGFFPRGYQPTKAELQERYSWLWNYGIKLDPEYMGGKDLTFEEMASWGSNRHLVVGISKTRAILGDGFPDLKAELGVERKNQYQRYSRLDLLRFGAMVVEENNGSLEQNELDAKYASTFISSPTNTVLCIFGTYTNFWLEFGYLPTRAHLDKHTVMSLGVRHAIKNNGAVINDGEIRNLSAERLFPSPATIQSRFDKISTFRSEVAENYRSYAQLVERLAKAGIDTGLVEIIGINCYESGSSFETWLTDNLDTLLLLSKDSDAARYVQRLMCSGLDLKHEELFNMQLEDLSNALKKLCILTVAGQTFVFRVIPRLSLEDVK